MIAAGRIILVFIALLVFSALLLLIIPDYNTLISELTRLAGAKSDNLMRQLLPPGKLLIVKVFLALFLILDLTCLFYWNRVLTYLNFIEFSFFKRKILEFKRVFIGEYVYVLLVVPIGALLYFALALPVSYDEAFTYSTFSSKGVLTSMAYYPFPNNHILFSILTSLILKIPVGNELFLIRLPSILFHILSITTAYFFFRSILRETKATYLATGVMSMMFMSIYYGYMARGYSIELFSFILLSFSAFLLVKEHKNIYWVSFFLASVIGFYTIPSFLYAFALANIFIAVMTRRISKAHLIVGVLIVIVVVVLYLPVIIVNGVGSLANNKYVKPIDRMDVMYQLPSFFYKSIESITGIVSWFWLLCLLVASWFLIKGSNKSLNIYLLICLICPAIFLTLHSVIPFPRTFNYYVVIFSLLVVLPVINFLPRISTRCVLIVSVVTQLALLLNFNAKIKDQERYSMVAKEVNEKLMAGRTFYINDSRIITYLIFELETHHVKDFDFIFRPSEIINADTIRREFDYYIIEKPNDRTVNRGLVAETEYFNVYR